MPRFMLENVDGYDSDYHHAAIMTQLEMDAPSSFAAEMLRFASHIMQFAGCVIHAIDECEIHSEWNHVECDDHPDCDFDDNDDRVGDCGCFWSHDFVGISANSHFTVLDGYRVDFTIDTRSECYATVSYHDQEIEVDIESETVSQINEHYQEEFDKYCV